MMRTRLPILSLIFVILALGAGDLNVLAQSSRAPESVEWRVVTGDQRPGRKVTLLRLVPDSEEWFLAGSDLADLLQVGRYWRADVRKLVLRIGDQRLTFTVGARSVVGADRTILLRQPVRYHAGEAWIPLEFLRDVLGELTDREIAVLDGPQVLRLGERSMNVTALGVQIVDGVTELRLRLRDALAFRVDDSRVQNLVIKIYGGQLDPRIIRLTQPNGLIDRVTSSQERGFALVNVEISELAQRYQSLTEENGEVILLRVEPAPVTLIPEPRPAGPHLVQTLPPEAEGRNLEIRRIVVDAGHGGADLGAEGANGLVEKDITLAVARELKRQLEGRHDIEVVLTRSDDSSMGLVERTEFANRNGADLFLSLHCNAWVDRRASGVETYFLSPAKSEWDADVARKENAEVGAAEDLDFILWDLVQNAYIQESATLAEEVQERLVAETGMANRGVKQAGFRVLVGAFMPAILVELGFVTNGQDAAKLSDPDWHRTAAAALADAVVQFRARMDALRERTR